MIKNLASRLRDGVSRLQADERGAESSEVIIILGVVVLGVAAYWFFLRDKLKKKISQTGDCLDNSSTATGC